MLSKRLEAAVVCTSAADSPCQPHSTASGAWQQLPRHHSLPQRGSQSKHACLMHARPALLSSSTECKAMPLARTDTLHLSLKTAALYKQHHLIGQSMPGIISHIHPEPSLCRLERLSNQAGRVTPACRLACDQQLMQTSWQLQATCVCA